MRPLARTANRCASADRPSERSRGLSFHQGVRETLRLIKSVSEEAFLDEATQQSPERQWQDKRKKTCSSPRTRPFQSPRRVSCGLCAHDRNTTFERCRCLQLACMPRSHRALGEDMWNGGKRTRWQQAAGLAILGLLLSSCDPGSETPRPPTSPTALREAFFSPSNPKPLALKVNVSPLPHGARLSGATNLPDGTELMVSVSRASVSAGEKVSVSGGKFTQDLYPNAGKPIPPGDYEVEVMTPLGAFQPEAVKGQLGENYEALTGPLLVTDDVGRVIEYRSKIRLDGPPNAAADRTARRKAYQDHVAFSERSCRSNPDTLEKLTGAQLSPERRAESVRRCLKTMAKSRKELAADGLVQP